MFTKNYYIAQASANSLTRVNRAGNDYFHKLIDINGNEIFIKEYFIDETKYPTYDVSLVDTNIIYRANSHPKVNKSKLISMTDSVSETQGMPYGVVFGNGTEPESYNNYNMAGELFTTYNYSSTGEYFVDENGLGKTITYTLTNTGTEDFTISEIGLVGYCHEYFKGTSSSRYYYYHSLLFERTLLENPITIPANGGVGQVAYTIRLDYPVPPVEE